MGQILIITAALAALLTAGIASGSPAHQPGTGAASADVIMPSGGG